MYACAHMSLHVYSQICRHYTVFYTDGDQKLSYHSKEENAGGMETTSEVGSLTQIPEIGSGEAATVDQPSASKNEV